MNPIDSIIVKSVCTKKGIPEAIVHLFLEGCNEIGWQLRQKRTHSDVHLPVVWGIPPVLEGDR